MLADVAKGGGIGLVKGGIGLAGMPAMRENSCRMGAKLSAALGHDVSPETVSHICELLPGRLLAGPTSEKIRSGVET